MIINLKEVRNMVNGGEISKTEDLIKEIVTIDERAWELALSVHKDTSLRDSVKKEAEELQNRLLDLANMLEKAGPVYPNIKKIISESILDLDFVAREGRFASLRLGHLIRREQSKI